MIGACILAGGLSSRMGQDKARLQLQGQSLLTRARQVAKAAGLKVQVQRRDAVPRCGPLGGVYTALRRTQAEAILFLSCDMPFVTADLLQALLAQLRPGVLAVSVRHQGRFNFPMLFRRVALPAIEGLISKGEFSLQALARTLKAVPVPVPNSDARTLFNINTPADHRLARKLVKEATGAGQIKIKSKIKSKGKSKKPREKAA